MLVKHWGPAALSLPPRASAPLSGSSHGLKYSMETFSIIKLIIIIIIIISTITSYNIIIISAKCIVFISAYLELLEFRSSWTWSWWRWGRCWGQYSWSYLEPSHVGIIMVVIHSSINYSVQECKSCGISVTKKGMKTLKTKTTKIKCLQLQFILKTCLVYEDHGDWLLCTLPGRRPGTAKGGERQGRAGGIVFWDYLIICTY